MKYEKLYKNLLKSVPTWKEGVVKAERKMDDHKKEEKKKPTVLKQKYLTYP